MGSQADSNGLVITSGPKGYVQMLSDKEAKPYNFDHVLESSCTQRDVYEIVRKDIEDTLRGINTTILAYGQTGSGKTHTMEGDLNNPENQGVVPRAIQSLFAKITSNEEQYVSTEFTCKCSHIEVYNDKVYDLLDPVGRVQKDVRQNQTGFFVSQCIEKTITSSEDALAVYSEGIHRRYKAETVANHHSSRSHSIFTLRIESTSKPQGEGPIVRTSCLQLVDLAGSESMKETDATGARGKEGRQINLSLSSLSLLVSNLANKPSFWKTESRSQHFRESPLLQVLQESLGGNCHTTFLITINQDPACLPQTKSTLVFAQNAKKIKNTPKINARETLDYMSTEQLRNFVKNLQAENVVLAQQMEFKQIESEKSQLELLNLVESMQRDHQFELDMSRKQYETVASKAHQMEKELETLKSELVLKGSEVDRARSAAAKSANVAAQLNSPIRFPSATSLASPIRTPASRMSHLENQLKEAQSTIELLQNDIAALDMEKKKMKESYESKLAEVNGDFDMLEHMQEENMAHITQLQSEVEQKTLRIISLEQKLAELEVKNATMKADITKVFKEGEATVNELERKLAERESELERATKKIHSLQHELASSAGSSASAGPALVKKPSLRSTTSRRKLAVPEEDAQEKNEANGNTIIYLETKIAELERSLTKAAKAAHESAVLNDRLQHANLRLAAIMKKRATPADIKISTVDIPIRVVGKTASINEATGEHEEPFYSVEWSTNTKPSLIRSSELAEYFCDLIEEYDEELLKKRAEAAGQRKTRSSARLTKGDKEKENMGSENESGTPSKKNKRSKRHSVAPASPNTQALLNAPIAAPNVRVSDAAEASLSSMH